jgi:hypothetical protein
MTDAAYRDFKTLALAIAAKVNLPVFSVQSTLF